MQVEKVGKIAAEVNLHDAYKVSFNDEKLEAGDKREVKKGDIIGISGGSRRICPSPPFRCYK